MAITVVIPTCDGITTICSAIFAIGQQTQHIEKIVVYENNSKMPLTEYSAFSKAFGYCASKGIELDYHFKVYKNGKKDFGKVRDDAFRLATTEYVFRLDDDVLLEPNVIKNCLEVSKLMNVDFVQCKVQDCNGMRGHSDFSYLAGEQFNDTAHGFGITEKLAKVTNSFNTSCVLVKRNEFSQFSWEHIVGDYIYADDLLYSTYCAKKGLKGAIALNSRARHWFTRNTTRVSQSMGCRNDLVNEIIKGKETTNQ